MNLRNLREHWNRLGRADPLWATLALPSKKGNKWKVEDFFETGRAEVDSIVAYIKSLGANLQHGKALDFGCGVGRLTQSLARYFDQVYGVDIAESMVELAKKHNRHPEKCKYMVNEVNDLSLFPNDTFDLIYTTLTLQHIEPKYTWNYLKEFLRVLDPHGLLIFQLPSEPARTVRGFIIRVTPSSLLNIYRRVKYRGLGVMEMHAIRREEVTRFLTENGARILEVREDHSAGNDWLSYRYSVVKK